MIDDINVFRKILQEAIGASNPDLNTIAKYITIDADAEDGIDTTFKILVNDTFASTDYNVDDNDDDDMTVTVTTIELRVTVPYDTESIPYTNGLSLNYEYNPDVDDDDDRYTRFQMVKDWFGDGNYDEKLKSYLLAAGISQSAANDIEVDGMLDDMIEYVADAVADEIADTVRASLNQGMSTLISKFGPSVLNANIAFTALDLEPHKHNIVKFLLTDIKTRGAGSKIVTNIVRKLRNANINWPELGVIEKSLNALKPG